MLPKPSECQGCPLYGDGKGFVPDEVVPGAKVFMLMQGPGAVEEREGKPACGPTGEIMDTHFLPLAGLERGRDVSVGNVLKCRPIRDGKRTDALPPPGDLEVAVQQCTRAYLRIPSDVTHVIAQGDLAASYRAGEKVNINEWRGFQLHKSVLDKPTYAVVHLASLLHDPKLWWVSELDWRKAGRWLRGEWPLPTPTYTELTDDNIQQALGLPLELEANHNAGAYIVCDTEFVGSVHVAEPGFLTCLGWAVVGVGGISRGYSADWGKLSGHSKGLIARWFHTHVKQMPIVFQNFAADMPILKRFLGLEFNAYKTVDDTMLAHAVLHCELPHTLRFLSSVYSPYGEHKSLAGLDQGRYNWGDVCATAALKESLWKEFANDPQAWGVYVSQSRALIPIILGAMERGIVIDRTAVMDTFHRLQRQATEAQWVAEAYLGYPINLGSDEQLGYYAYAIRGLPVQKHAVTKRPTVDAEAVDVLRDTVGPPVTGGDSDSSTLYARLGDNGDPVLEARVCYGAAQHLIDSYIYGLLKEVHNATSPQARKRARTKASREGFTEADICEVIHPNYAIHTQKNARWSTTDPPLAQLPDALRGLLIPRPGHIHIGWDWKGIELRVLEAESRSKVLAQAHNDNIDLHTWTCCRMFGWDLPPNLVDPDRAPDNAAWRERYAWKGSGDPRRVFAKSARYEMNYGGHGGTAARKAIGMGLKPAEVKQALGRLLTADSQYYAWRARIEREVRDRRIIRTFLGRPRRFVTVSRQRGLPPKVVREALDYPMQGAVSDVFNLTVCKIAEVVPHARFVWSMHDSQYWEFSREKYPDVRGLLDTLRGIAECEWDIHGYKMRFPADFKVIYHPGEAP